MKSSFLILPFSIYLLYNILPRSKLPEMLYCASIKDICISIDTLLKEEDVKFCIL